MLAEQHADTVVVRAPAKVNLFLEILKKRPDGYHELVTCMVAVNLFDTLAFKEEPSGTIQLQCDAAALPTGPENLVWRAAELLRQHTGVARGVQVVLTKQIPLAAGLAGGSTDAAATLFGLNQLWQTGLGLAELGDLAARLGSDVPFFFSTPPISPPSQGGAAGGWCTGRGEQVAPFALPRPLDLVLACPPVGLSTAEVYRGVTVPSEPVSPDAMRAALHNGQIEELGAALHNRLQPVAEKLSPEVAELRRVFTALNPAGHLMSGSGSSYFALARSRQDAEQLACLVQQTYRSPRPDGPGLRIFVLRTLQGES